MNLSPLNYDVLVILLPALLFPILAAVVAAIGLRRWRPSILALAIASLILLLVGALLFSSPLFARSLTEILESTHKQTQQFIAATSLQSSMVVGSIGVFYALIQTARVQGWGWFTAITAAAIISTTASMTIVNPGILFDTLSNDQVHSLASAPGFKIIIYILASLSLIVILLYALLSRRSPVTAAAPSMADDVTLP